MPANGSAAAAREAAAGPYSWDAVAEQTLALYRELRRMTVVAVAFWARSGCSSTRTLAIRRVLWAADAVAAPGGSGGRRTTRAPACR